MKLHMEYVKDGWTTRQEMSLPDDEKLATKILGCVKRHLAEQEKKVGEEGPGPDPVGAPGKPEALITPVEIPTEAEASPLSQAAPASSPVGGALERRMRE